MVGRNWGSLSPSYRQRLERGGINRADYESGATLSRARGHATTPERPQEAAKDEERYREYLGRRADAVRLIQRAKESMFGTSDKWDASKSLKYINKHLDGTERGAAQIKRAAAIAAQVAEGEIDLDTVREDYPDIWELFFYN